MAPAVSQLDFRRRAQIITGVLVVNGKGGEHMTNVLRETINLFRTLYYKDLSLKVVFALRDFPLLGISSTCFITIPIL